MFRKILVGLLFMFLASGASFARTSRNIKADKKSPINITSETVEIFRDKNQIIFIDKVKAVQSDFTLYADRMTVNYREGLEKKIDVVNITTEKNVRFINEDIVATGNNGFYDVEKNLITLKNNVKVTESGITVFAEEFQYNVITGKTNIKGNSKGGSDRVTIILDNVEDLRR